MKKLLAIVAALFIATNLYAQEKPLTFQGVKIIDLADTVKEQFMERGFAPVFRTGYLLEGQYRGLTVKLLINYSRSTGMATGIIIIPVDDQMYSAAEAAKRYNDMLDEFNANPNYTADPKNKRVPAGEDVAQAMLNDKTYYAYFYQDGDRRKCLEMSIHEYDGKYYVGESYYLDK